MPNDDEPYENLDGSSKQKSVFDKRADSMEQSHMSANPVAGRISVNQAGPKRNDPSPIRDGPYNEYEHPEVILNESKGS